MLAQVHVVELVGFFVWTCVLYISHATFGVDISRGTTRGGGRGAAPRGSGRGQWATGSSRPSPTIGNDSSTATATPSAWNLGPPASLGTPALSSDAATVEPVPVAEPELDEGTYLPPTTSIAEENKPASLLRDLNAVPAELHPTSHTAESKRPASRVIPPGTKMSWAQIARFAHSSDCR